MKTMKVRSRTIVWLLYLGVLILIYIGDPFTDDGDISSGGACALMGFGFLIVLLIGTAIEVMTTRKHS